MKKIFFILMMLVAVANAANHEFTKQVDLNKLKDKLESEGFLVDGIDCHGISCIVRLDPSENKDPGAIIAAHIYVDPAVALATLKSDIEALTVKLRANTITTAEKDELLDKMLQHMGF